jgi:hypothetical protein
MENSLDGIGTAIAEGVTSAFFVSELSGTERLFVINFLGAIAIRLVWYSTEKKILQAKAFFYKLMYKPEPRGEAPQPPRTHNDQARNFNKNWRTI